MNPECSSGQDKTYCGWTDNKLSQSLSVERVIVSPRMTLVEIMKSPRKADNSCGTWLFCENP